MAASRILIANALFSSGGALIMIGARNRLYPLLGLESTTLLLEVGIALLAYSAWLLREARRPQVSTTTLRLVAMLDAAWVVASVLVLIAAWDALAPIGRGLIIGTAAIVELFAVLEFRALAVSNRSSAEAVS
jgi:hypothetical protein